MNRPVGREAHKRLAKVLGLRSVTDLLALDRKSDPFYAEADPIVEWFATLWNGRPDYIRHLRGFHYWLFGEEAALPNGERYDNTLPHWSRLKRISVTARDLGLVDADDFDDLRNAEAVTNAPGAPEEPEVFLPDGLAPLPEPPVVALPDWDNGLAPLVWATEYEPAHQPYRLVLFAEKASAADAVADLCEQHGVDLIPGKGTTSRTRIAELASRAEASGCKGLAIGYISDFDTQGNSMPRSVARRMEHYLHTSGSDLHVVVEEVALTKAQVLALGLPPQPTAKHGTGAWTEKHGGIVELDALLVLRTGLLEDLVEEWIARWQDPDLADLRGDYDEQCQELAAQAMADALGDDLLERVGAMESSVDSALETYRAAVRDAARRLTADLADLAEDHEALDEAVASAMEGLAVELPEQPEGTVVGDPSDAAFFASTRPWWRQIDFYRRQKAEDPLEIDPTTL